MRRCAGGAEASSSAKRAIVAHTSISAGTARRRGCYHRAGLGIGEGEGEGLGAGLAVAVPSGFTTDREFNAVR